MTEILIPVINSYTNLYIGESNWWSNFFYSCGDWHEVQRVLEEDWNAEVVPSPRFGEVGTIKFENDEDATMFMLRWS